MGNRFEIRRGERLAEVLSQLIAPTGAYTAVTLADGPTLRVALQTLLELNDERASPYLVMPLVMADHASSDACARVLEQVMPRDLTGIALLEAHVRDRSWYRDSWWWSDDDRPRFQMPVADGQARAALQRGLPISALGLLSMNANGRAREQATRALAEASGGRELPFLMLRANDWVSKVSTSARRAILQRCVPENAAAFVAVLPFLERLLGQSRVDMTGLLQAIEAMLLGSSAGLDAIEVAARSAKDVSVRRSIARRARTWELPLSRVESALSDRDAATRTQFALAVAERATDEELARFVPRLFDDKSPLIRRVAFQGAERRLPDVLQRALPQFLFDRNSWLRELARQKLSAHGYADFATAYRLTIEKGDAITLRAAIDGLSDVGAASDAHCLLPYLAQGGSRLRQTALRAVCTLLKQEAAPHLLLALASELGGVSKTACQLLCTRHLAVTAAELTPLLDSHPPHVRANALQVLAGSDRWEALVAALERSSDSDERVAAAARAIVAPWRAMPPRLYSRPTAEQRRRLRAALLSAPASAAQLDPLVVSIAGSG